MTTIKKENHYNKTYKLIAQTFGLIVCLFFIFFIIGDFPEIMKGKDEELLRRLPLLILPIVGYFLTWYKEKAGAYVMIAGGLFLFVYFILMSDYAMSLVYGLPFIITGALFILHLKKRDELKRKNK